MQAEAYRNKHTSESAKRLPLFQPFFTDHFARSLIWFAQAPQVPVAKIPRISAACQHVIFLAIARKFSSTAPWGAYHVLIHPEI
jgi:hypothetical protein